MKKKSLVDITGKTYQIDDFDKFINHINDYHTINGRGDGSIHEEEGYYFKITPEFYQRLLEK